MLTKFYYGKHLKGLYDIIDKQISDNSPFPEMFSDIDNLDSDIDINNVGSESSHLSYCNV